MKAICVHQFGGLDALIYEDVSRPSPGEGKCWFRSGLRSWSLGRADPERTEWTPSAAPLTLGSDFSGIVKAVGPGVSAFQPGDGVYGVTNSLFIGAYAEYAVADVTMVALKPLHLTDVEAASAPVVACTAWQMLFDHGRLDATKRVLVQGAAGNVGAYAIQLAREVGAEVIGTAFPSDIDYVRSLGANRVIDVSTTRFEDEVTDVDIVLDTVGGDTLDRSFAVLKPEGVLVSVVYEPDPVKAALRDVRGVFFYVAVTTDCLIPIAERFESGRLRPAVGEVLPLADARLAHEMLAGKPHKRGKIVLTVEGN